MFAELYLNLQLYEISFVRKHPHGLQIFHIFATLLRNSSPAFGLNSSCQSV